VTIPRGGSRAEARSFAQRNLGWLEETLARWQQQARVAADDNRILFRGETIPIVMSSADEVLLGAQMLRVKAGSGRFAARFESGALGMAKAELPMRLNGIGCRSHGLVVKRGVGPGSTFPAGVRAR